MNLRAAALRIQGSHQFDLGVTVTSNQGQFTEASVDCQGIASRITGENSGSSGQAEDWCGLRIDPSQWIKRCEVPK